MKLPALLIIALSLTAGVIGALTAYAPRIDTPDAAERLAGTQLNAPAGIQRDEAGQIVRDEDGRPVPIATAETELTPELIEQLRAAGVQRVKIREFRPGRWTGAWLFAIGAIGLLAAGVFLRIHTGRTAAMNLPRSARRAPEDPAAILAAMREQVDSLLQTHRSTAAPATTIPGTAPQPPAPGPAGEPAAPFVTLAYGGPGMNALIVEQVGEMQKTLMPAFIDARPRLVAAGGLARYAQLMDVFAAAERSLNRAWSAAADGADFEAIEALHRGQALLEEAAARLPQG